MRVITWNMNAGFAYNSVRHERAWHYLRALDPDVALLQEVIPPDWAQREWKIFAQQTYTAKPWGSAVLVKDGLYSWNLEAPPDRQVRQYEGSSTVLVEISRGLALERLLVASIYASARELTADQVKQLQELGPDLDELRFGGEQDIWPLYAIFHDLTPLLSGRPFVIGGDLNAARLMDQSPWLPGGSSEFFDMIEAGGFCNTLAKFKNGEVQTYFRRNNQPYQLDHLFCDKSSVGRLSACCVIEHPVTVLDLSDHAPIVADFAM